MNIKFFSIFVCLIGIVDSACGQSDEISVLIDLHRSKDQLVCEVTLQNHTRETIEVWQNSGLFGRWMYTVVFSTESGERFALSREGSDFTGPDYLTHRIDPGEEVKVILDLADGSWVWPLDLVHRRDKIEFVELWVDTPKTELAERKGVWCGHMSSGVKQVTSLQKLFPEWFYSIPR